MSDAAPWRSRAEEIALAQSCARGDAASINVFVSEQRDMILQLAQRVRARGVSPEDAAQMVLSRLLVGVGDSPPRIAGYTGAGSLRSWVRATTARLLIDIHRSKANELERPTGDPIALELVDSDDPEIRMLRRECKHALDRALREATAALPPRARNHLRHALVEGLSIDAIAALYGVHRSTSARRLAAAREHLLTDVRERLAAELSLSRVQLNSVLRYLSGRLDASLARLLHADPNAATA